MINKKKVISIRTRHLISGQEKNGPKLAFLKNMNLFVKDFNEKTKNESSKVVSVKFLIYSDNSFSYKIRGVPSTLLLKEFSEEKKEINSGQLSNLVKVLLPYTNSDNESSVYKILLGTLKSTKIKLS